VVKSFLTNKTINFTLLIHGPTTLTFKSIRQYDIEFDSSDLSCVDQVSPSTVPGDKFWYDKETPVSLSLDRSCLGGIELVSAYVLNGHTVNVMSDSGSILGTVSVFLNFSITGPQRIHLTSVVWLSGDTFLEILLVELAILIPVIFRLHGIVAVALVLCSAEIGVYNIAQLLHAPVMVFGSAYVATYPAGILLSILVLVSLRIGVTVLKKGN
jgi:hypothetical protein